MGRQYESDLIPASIFISDNKKGLLTVMEREAAGAARNSVAAGGLVAPNRMRAQLEQLAQGQMMLMDALARLEQRMDAEGKAAPTRDPMAA